MRNLATLALALIVSGCADEKEAHPQAGPPASGPGAVGHAGPRAGQTTPQGSTSYKLSNMPEYTRSRLSDQST